MSKPNLDNWFACKEGESVLVNGKPCRTRVVACGDLKVSSGRLLVCDPLAIFPDNNPFLLVPSGNFPVFVTLIDISKKQNLVAYASIVFEKTQESYRKWIPLAHADDDRKELEGDEQGNVGVDNALACFIDESSLKKCMPPLQAWGEVFNDEPNGWLPQLENSTNIQPSMANVILPKAKKGENVVLFRSGVGDGNFPLVGSFKADDKITAVHIDFVSASKS